MRGGGPAYRFRALSKTVSHSYIPAECRVYGMHTVSVWDIFTAYCFYLTINLHGLSRRNRQNRRDGKARGVQVVGGAGLRRKTPGTARHAFIRCRARRETLERFSRRLPETWLKPRPESGLDWLVCGRFARQRRARNLRILVYLVIYDSG